MPKTISEAFDKFSSDLELTGLQATTVSTRQQAIRDVVAKKLTVLETFLTGSYMRDTMIGPLSKADVDIFVVLDPKYYSSHNPKSLLDLTMVALKESYPLTPKISANGQAVTITFADFVVDVVPGFYRNGGGYIIGNASNNTWIETNPKYHIEYKTVQNTVHNGKLVPIIKMLKSWNRHNNNALQSFYLELMATKIFNKVLISDYPSGVRFFFDKGREVVRYTVSDPVSFGGQVRGLRNVKTVEAAVKLFQDSYDKAIKAESYAKLGYNQLAVDIWGELFDYFPAYAS